MDAFHRIVSGQALTRGQLVGAGVFVAIWFLMDVIQFADMVVGWIDVIQLAGTVIGWFR